MPPLREIRVIRDLMTFSHCRHGLGETVQAVNEVRVAGREGVMGHGVPI